MPACCSQLYHSIREENSVGSKTPKADRHCPCKLYERFLQVIGGKFDYGSCIAFCMLFTDIHRVS